MGEIAGYSKHRAIGHAWGPREISRLAGRCALTWHGKRNFAGCSRRTAWPHGALMFLNPKAEEVAKLLRAARTIAVVGLYAGRGRVTV